MAIKKTQEERDYDAFHRYHHSTRVLEPGWSQKSISEGYFKAGVAYGRAVPPNIEDPGSISYANDVIARLLKMSAEAREMIFSEFCKDCGSANLLSCKCEKE